MIDEQLKRLDELTDLLNKRDNELMNDRKRLRLFNKIIVKANESGTQKDLVQGILDSTIELLSFDIGGIYLLNKNKNATLIATHGIKDECINKIDDVDCNCGEFKDVLSNGKPVFYNKYDEFNKERSSILGGVKTLVRVPIIYDDIIKGCFSIGTFDNREILPEECSIFKTLGKHLGHVLYRLEVEMELENKIITLESLYQELKATEEELRNQVIELEDINKNLKNLVYNE